jgi:adhesin transport system outer membrane protein
MKKRQFLNEVLFIYFLFLTTAYATSLDEAILIAIETNPTIGVDEANVKAADYEIDAARAKYFPSLTVAGSGGRQYTKIDNKLSALSFPLKGHATRWVTNPVAVLRQTIFDGLATPFAVERAHQAEEVARSTLGQTTESIAYQAVSAYANVYAQTQLLAAANNNIEKHRDLLDKVTKRVKGGISTLADVYQVESRLQEALALKERTLGQLEVARADFLDVVGFFPDQLELPSLPNDNLFSCNIDQLLGRVFLRNPGIVLAAAQEKEAEAEFDQTLPPFLPTIRAETLANAPVLNQSGTKGVENTYTVQLVGEYNLFRGGEDLAKRRAQRERVVAAKKQLAVARRTAEKQSRSAWETGVSAQAQTNELSTALKVDNELEHAYLIQFQLVARPLVDLLNAYVTTYRDESDFINAQAQEVTNLALLLASMGDLTKVAEQTVCTSP